MGAHSEVTPEERKRYVAAIQAKHMRVCDVMLEAGVTRNTVAAWIDRYGEDLRRHGFARDFSAPAIPSSDRTAEEILAAKKVKLERVRSHYEAKRLLNVNIHLDGPVAFAFLGDPHLDDDGCDIVAFERDVDLIDQTEGMFAFVVGDWCNTWIGRFMAFYANQITTRSEGWVLAEWAFTKLQRKMIGNIAGNHDAWAGSEDPLAWLSHLKGLSYIHHGARMKLNLPDGSHIMLNLAHDFPGHSQWNPVHGHAKKQWKWDDDLLVCGHKHNTAIGMVPSVRDSRPCWMIRCDSYKVFDDYPGKLGIDETQVAPCVVAVIDPEATTAGRITIFLDPAEAANYLTYKRQLWNQRKTRLKRR